MIRSNVLAAAIVLLTAAFGTAASAAGDEPDVAWITSSKSPPVPAGMKVTCMENGTLLQQAPQCPVIVYHGVTTWVFSFIDNRVGVALVSYDANNNIVRTVEKSGTRYVWGIVLDSATQTAIIAGQANNIVTASWSELGTP